MMLPAYGGQESDCISRPSAIFAQRATRPQYRAARDKLAELMQRLAAREPQLRLAA
jgi:hypothetical protein